MKTQLIRFVRSTILLYAFLIVPLSAIAETQGSSFGAGIILGDPSALTGKYWLSGGKTAIDFGLSFSNDDYVLLYADYLVHFPGVLAKHEAAFRDVAPYFGIGGVAVSTTRDRSREDRFLGKRSGSFGAGVRIPFGLEWRPAPTRLGVFFEIVPGLSIFPSTSGFFEAGLGLRYYF